MFDHNTETIDLKILINDLIFRIDWKVLLNLTQVRAAINIDQLKLAGSILTTRFREKL